jgi:hypothetical protein
MLSPALSRRCFTLQAVERSAGVRFEIVLYPLRPNLGLNDDVYMIGADMRR